MRGCGAPGGVQTQPRWEWGFVRTASECKEPLAHADHSLIFSMILGTSPTGVTVSVVTPASL